MAEVTVVKRLYFVNRGVECILKSVFTQNIGKQFIISQRQQFFNINESTTVFRSINIVEQLDKHKKNYTRVNLLELIPAIGESSIIVHGKYKHTSDLDWETFTTIRPHIEMHRTYTICDHLNVKRRILEKWYQLDECYHNRKFCLIGIPSAYNYYGDIRGCLILNQELGIQPIIFNEEKDDKITQDTLNKLYKFPEVYIRGKWS